MREVLRVAAALHIQVIPEIDVPGHARSAIEALAPLLQEVQQEEQQAAEQAATAAGAAVAPLHADRSEYNTAQNFEDNVLNPALAST